MVEPVQQPEPASQGAAPSETELLLNYLKYHDAFCPLCKYNLRNLTIPRCPECGREIKIAIGLTEPFLLPWILTTIFVAMAASIGVLFIVGVVVEGPPHLAEVRSLEEIVPCIDILYGVAAIPLTFVLITARQRFFRLARSAQITLAITAFSMDALLLFVSFAVLH